MENGVEISGKASGGVEADLFVFTVNPSNYTGVSLINCKLNGSNYLTWSRAMLTALIAKNKVRMIDGSVPRPSEGDPNRANVTCATVAQTLWEDLRERYSQGNETRIYQLKAEIDNLKQEGMSIPKYYFQLKTIWVELDNYFEIPACTCSAARMYAAHREQEIHQFLMGLGSEYSTVRSNILSHEPAHSLNKVHALILHEERQNMVALSHESSAPDGAAFLGRTVGNKLEIQNSRSSSNYGGQGRGRGGTSKTCYHCGSSGHIKSACWLLHGFPANWESRQSKDKMRSEFAGRKTGGSGIAGQRRTALGPGQFSGLQAHQTRLGQSNSGPSPIGRLHVQSSSGPNSFGGLQAHQAQLG
ncbi:hypothetical protein CRG98_045865 [Punica granatum]|uniref:CCHC-type domain-containing protein n=1 Tax=Punica granatum TaxID=22663 RepID=A0A2I0HQ86_PUNGR|nr:hypothetical protein CRG98_045865 [Punica granatum]